MAAEAGVMQASRLHFRSAPTRWSSGWIY